MAHLPMHKLRLSSGEGTRRPQHENNGEPSGTSANTKNNSERLLVAPGSSDHEALRRRRRRPAPRVAFAETGKDAVDFLFSILALPLAMADKLLGGAVGSVGNLRASVEALDPVFVQPGAARESLLRPTVLSPPAARAELSFHPRRQLYTCPTRIYAVDCGRSFTDGRGAACPSCGDEMTAVARYVPPPSPGSTAGAPAGFVAATSRYVVTDGLSVFPAPTSAASGVAVLRDLGVRNVGALRQMDVQLGRKEGEEILKASLQSKTVLTDVYLRRRSAPGCERTHAALEYASASPGRL